MNTEGKNTLDEKIDELIDELDGYSAESDEFLNTAKAIEILCQARSHPKATTWKGISVETIIAAGTNILGILLVLNYEKFNVITSKAFGMISKK